MAHSADAVPPAPSARPKRSGRSRARKRALDLLYAADLRGRSALDELSQHVGEGNQLNSYTAVLVEGVCAHQARLDELITAYAEGWSLERMPAVDRNILRLGIFEVLYAEGLPTAVAISESVNLARDLSTDDSPAFVNGILGSVVRDRSTLV